MRKLPRLNRSSFFLGDLLLNLFVFPVIKIPENKIVEASAWSQLLVITFLGICFYYIFKFRLQRLHDLGWSNWWLIVTFMPFAEIVLWILPGEAGPNRYGKPHAKQFDFRALF